MVTSTIQYGIPKKKATINIVEASQMVPIPVRETPRKRPSSITKSASAVPAMATAQPPATNGIESLSFLNVPTYVIKSLRYLKEDSLMLDSVMSEPVVILVGEDKDEFFVHAHLLRSSSRYFEVMLGPKRKREDGTSERTFKTIKLQDANTDAFLLFSKWLYTGHFHLSSEPKSQVAEALQSQEFWDRILSCYNLSVLLESSRFGDATIDALIQCMTIANKAPTDLAKSIYSRSSKDSVHRLLCRDIVVHTWDRSTFSNLWKEDYPRDFIDSVLEEVGSNLESGVKRQSVREFLASKGPCAYHEHENMNESCYREVYGG